MPGAQQQIAMASSHDMWLYKDALGSWFDSQHMSYLNFATESRQIFSGGNKGFGQLVRFEITNQGEYICGGYIRTTISTATAPAAAGNVTAYRMSYVHMVGIYLYKTIEIEINSTKFDTHEPEYLDIWSRLTLSAEKYKAFKELIGEVCSYTRYGNGNTLYVHQMKTNHPQEAATTKPEFTIYLPLRFWFCNDHSQALPIGVMIFSKCYIDIELNPWTTVVQVWETTDANPNEWTTVNNRSTNTTLQVVPTIKSMDVFLDYVYLDRLGRTLLGHSSKFYVIKHVKNRIRNDVSGNSVSQRLDMVMPVTELLWVVRESGALADKNYHIYDRYYDNSGSTITANTLYNLPDSPFAYVTFNILNENRVTRRDHVYYTKIQPLIHHTAPPDSEGFGMYSFALWPENYRMSSGCANFSSVDYANLILEWNQTAGINGNATAGIGKNSVTGTLYIYGVAHNYVYVRNGFGSLLFTA
jgi:uncharacterized short protein YbdD (DUF466 family)